MSSSSAAGDADRSRCPDGDLLASRRRRVGSARISCCTPALDRVRVAGVVPACAGITTAVIWRGGWGGSGGRMARLDQHGHLTAYGVVNHLLWSHAVLLLFAAVQLLHHLSQIPSWWMHVIKTRVVFAPSLQRQHLSTSSPLDCTQNQILQGSSSGSTYLDYNCLDCRGP